MIKIPHSVSICGDSHQSHNVHMRYFSVTGYNMSHQGLYMQYNDSLLDDHGLKFSHGCLKHHSASLQPLYIFLGLCNF